MNNDLLKPFLRETFGADALSDSFGMCAVEVPSLLWRESLATVRAALTPGHSMLVCLSAVDRVEKGFELFAHLRDVEAGSDVVLKTMLEKSQELPAIDSLCSLWEAAELMEDELYDLFGIRFDGHPRLRRIMLDDEFAGYPLRKEFKPEENNG